MGKNRWNLLETEKTHLFILYIKSIKLCSALTKLKMIDSVSYKQSKNNYSEFHIFIYSIYCELT